MNNDCHDYLLHVILLITHTSAAAAAAAAAAAFISGKKHLKFCKRAYLPLSSQFSTFGRTRYVTSHPILFHFLSVVFV